MTNLKIMTLALALMFYGVLSTFARADRVQPDLYDIVENCYIVDRGSGAVDESRKLIKVKTFCDNASVYNFSYLLDKCRPSIHVLDDWEHRTYHLGGFDCDWVLFGSRLKDEIEEALSTRDTSSLKPRVFYLRSF